MHRAPFTHRRPQTTGRGLLMTGALVALLAAPSPGAAQPITIDSFATSQPTLALTFPPTGTSASSSASGAGILGGERDIQVNLTSGIIAGNSINSTVSSGFFSYSQDATITGNAQIQWDGTDGSETLDPTGLGGVDLTAAGSQDALLLKVAFDDLPLNVVIEVFTDGGNASSTTLALAGLVFSSTDFVLPYSAFTTSLGAGADFTNVGAIRLTLGSSTTAPDVVIDSLTTTGPPVIVPPVINTTVDQSLGDCSVTCSLRDAVALSSPGATLAVPAGHYVLTLGHISITKNLKLAGSGARTTIIDGNNTSGGSTGGIFDISNLAISLEIDDMSLVNGVADQAGGALSALGQIVSRSPFVFNPVVLTIRRCTIDNNQVTGGQAGGVHIQLGTLIIEDSTFSNNSTSPLGGGGLLAGTVTGSIVNSTFSGNSAASFSRGGAMVLIGGTYTLVNDTITGNSGSAGGGITNFGNLTVTNTIVAGNAGGDCFSTSALVTDHSLDSDDTCGLTGPGDLPGVDPLLGPLANNGGPTDTQALLAGSPALDAGGNATCPAADQRGVTRPQRVVCDIGAVEMENVAPTLASNQASVTVNEGQTAANTGTVSDGNGDTVTLTASVGSVINHGDGTWSWSFLTSDGPTQSQTVTISGDDGHGGTSATTFSLVVNNVAPTIVSVSNNGPILVGGSAIITVTATDPAGANDPLAYSFDCDNNGTFEVGPQAGNSTACTFATTGSKTVNVRVTDGDGGTATGSTVVTVVYPPPSCASATASPNLLWPPNHKFVAIAIGGIANPAPGAATVTVTSIRQDEPTGGDVDGTGVGTSSPSVRSERDGGGDGRVYHINFTATGAGGSCTGSVTVGVPHDQGHGSLVDGGPLYNSTVP